MLTMFLLTCSLVRYGIKISPISNFLTGLIQTTFIKKQLIIYKSYMTNKIKKLDSTENYEI